MKQQTLSRLRFVIRIIFPVLLVIVLFLVAFYAIIIPGYERSIMERKSEMIRELTNSAWSVLNKYHTDEISGLLSPDEAQKEAIARIEYLRYGSDGKDYFWITDMHPVMVMHPYRKELNRHDLSGFTDPHGKHLFVEFIKAVKASKQGDGYVDYMWQWKDDTARIVPKLSYVKAFKPWGWVIGTGIYLEDVKQEIHTLEQGLLKIALAITLIVALLLVFIALQSYRLEQNRQKAEEKTRRSEEKYRTLVEATSEGTLMLADDLIVYSNKILQDLTGLSEQALAGQGLSGLFGNREAEKIRREMSKINTLQDKPVRLDTSLLKHNGEPVLVDLAISLLPLGNGFVHVLIINRVSREKVAVRMQENLTAELQASVLLLSRPVSELPKRYLSIELSGTIREAAGMMTEKGQDAILVRSENNRTVGIITDEDLRKRTVATGQETDEAVFHIMSAPLITIPDKAMLYEAIALMQERKISHLGIRNNEGEVVGIASDRELLQIHRFSLSFVKHEIEEANSVSDIRKISERIPELTSSLLKSGADSTNLVRFTAVMFDAIINRFIKLALIQLGEPPVPFTYLVMGSAGREEQTLATDQDNAIIFQDVEPDRLAGVSKWFLRLGTLVSEWLDEAGYHFCKGRIMANNPEWCQPLSTWKFRFSHWIASAEPQDLLDINIFFDFRPVYGLTEFATTLHDHIHGEINHHPAFFIFLTGNIQRLKPPLSRFGNIQVGGSKDQPDAFDIKLAMLPIVDIARLYALREGIEETGTLARLFRLHQKGTLSETGYHDRVEAYKTLLSIRFRHQVDQLLSGIPADNFINPEKLTHLDQALVKKIFDQTNEFIAKLGLDFKGGISG